MQKENPTHAKQLLILQCRYDLELFAVTFFPHYCTHEFNAFHRYYLEHAKKDGRNLRFAGAAPRGSAKSTFATVIKPIHDICYGLEKFIIIASATEDQASGKVKDIRRELLDNDLLRYIYGDFFRNKKVSETQYVATCQGHSTMVMALGAGTEVRGARFGPHRPSKIVCDDVEDSDEVHNQEIREKVERWYFEVISKLGNEETNIEFIGTVLHKDALLVKILKNPAYTSQVFKSVLSWADRTDLWDKWSQIYNNLDSETRLIDARTFFEENKEEMLKGTEVLWPDKRDYYKLMTDRVEIGDRAFQKEDQNNPLSDDRAIFKRFHYFREVDEGFEILETKTIVKWETLSPAFAVVDPATGKSKIKTKGDFTCIPIGYKDKKGRLFVYSDWTKRAEPSEFIKVIFTLNDDYEFDRMGVEENLYRNLLLDVIRKARDEHAKEKGQPVHVNFYDIINTQNKIDRVSALEPRITNGYILFNTTLSEEFKSQMQAFPLGDNDDCPDALEMLWGMAMNRYKAGGSSADALRGRR